MMLGEAGGQITRGESLLLQALGCPDGPAVFLCSGQEPRGRGQEAPRADVMDRRVLRGGTVPLDTGS